MPLLGTPAASTLWVKCRVELGGVPEVLGARAVRPGPRGYCRANELSHLAPNGPGTGREGVGVQRGTTTARGERGARGTKNIML